MRALAVLLAVLLWTGSAQAVQPDEILPDAALEQRARQISGGLRCLVCQNQSIDESDAPLARDLRIMVRERLVSGDSDQAVRDFVVTRYGEFVLLSPPVTLRTVALWGAPFAILGLALLFLWRRSRSMPRLAGSQAPLSDDERRRVDAVLKDEG